MNKEGESVKGTYNATGSAHAAALPERQFNLHKDGCKSYHTAHLRRTDPEGHGR